MSLFVFNNQQKLIKSIPNRDLISVVQDQAINVSDTLFVEMPADIWSNLKEPASYLAVQDPYERFSYHMYKVSKHTTKSDTTDIEAIQIGYDELKAYGYIKDRRFNNRPVLEAAMAIVDGTDWQLGYVDAELPNINTNFYYISRLEALSKLIEATGAEVRFRVEISGNKIIAKRLDLYKQLGTFKGKRFAYGSNLLEIIKEEDTSELYTALVGRGKGEETDTGGFGRRITFADVAWSKASGKPVDKPLGQEFIELPEMTAYYGYPDGEPRTGIVEFGDIEEPEQLLKATYERLVEISRPQVQFKAKVQTTGDMQLGEEVAIIRSDLGFRYKTRVFRVKRDYLNNMYTEVELGDKLTETLASRIKKIDTTINRQEQTLIQAIQDAANGKNKIFRGPVEPTEGMMVNDLWYKPIGDGEMEMYQWNGAIWELISSTLDTTRVRREVDAAIAEIEGVKTDINDRLLLVNQEVANNFTSLSTSIENVNNIAAQAQLDAIGALGIVNDVNVTVNQLNGEIDTLITRVYDNDVLINQVKSTADGTVQTVADHAGRITQVETNVNGLQTTVASKADQSQITQLSNAITSTVKDAVDTLEANGRNYFHKGLVMTNVLGNTNFVKFGDTTPQGFTVTGARDGRGYIRINNVITGNGLWTVTFDLGSPQLAAVGITVDVCDQGSKRFITRDDNKQERVSLTVNVTNHSSVYNFVDFGPMDWAHFVINNIKIEKGGKSTPYVIAIEDTASSSQMTQLSNQINLRVTKGDVMSQINIEAGRTLISSNKLYLDADTVTFSGSAFIPSAAISSLSADKVTTGTLNAANVNIINLNASSIVGLNSEFVKTAWNSINAQTTIVAEGIKQMSPLGEYVMLEKGGARFYTKEGVMNGSIESSYRDATGDTGVGVFIEPGKVFEIVRNNGSPSKNVTLLRIPANKDIIEITKTLEVSRINIAGTNQYIANFSNGGGIYYDTAMVSLGIGTPAEVYRKLAVTENSIDLYAALSLNSKNINDVSTIYAKEFRLNGTSQRLVSSVNEGGAFIDTTKVSLGISHLSGGGWSNKLSVTNDKVEVYTTLSAKTINIRGTNQYIINSSAGGGAYIDSTRVSLGVGTPSSWNNKITVTENWLEVYSNLRMNGFTISGQSDRRLKKDISDIDIDALSVLNEFNFVEFTWIDKDKPQDRQFGLIAQDTPFVSFQDENGVWNINSSKQIMLNSLGIKQLNNNVSQLGTFVSQHELEIKKLNKKIEELERKIA